jgi:hypothetical protein
MIFPPGLLATLAESRGASGLQIFAPDYGATPCLLLLISFTTNHGDDNLFHSARLPPTIKVGMGLHLAALAARVGVVELATRVRHRARNREIEERINRKQEALATARDREQTARRTPIQAGRLVVQCRFLLADTTRIRLQISKALAVLIEELSHRATDSLRTTGKKAMPRKLSASSSVTADS